MWRKYIVTVGGLGLLRPAPGTWGSVPPCAVIFVLAVFCAAPAWLLNTLLGLMAVASGVACILLGTWAERRFAGKDPGVVVIDEVAGMSLALLLAPLSPLVTDSGALGVSPGVYTFAVISAAFILFRILDIVKIQPANMMQQFPAGWGILLDDLVSAVYANIILQVFLRLVLPALS